MSGPATGGRSRNPVVRSAAYRYGLLAFILLLLVGNLWTFSHLHRPYKFDPYGNIILTLALLFNHVAFAFPWRRTLRITFEVVAFSWLAFVWYYIHYWSRVLFPPRY